MPGWPFVVVSGACGSTGGYDDLMGARARMSFG